MAVGFARKTHKEMNFRDLNSSTLKKAAYELGVKIVGVANIKRFEHAPRQMHPKNIFPDCKSVISIVMPIPRSVYRGITEGTHWANYTYYGYNRLNSLFRPKITYKVACFLEDHGYEAVSVFPGVAERPGPRKPVSPERPQPDVNLNVRIAGLACGVGEIGWSKVFLTKEYGPRVRLGTILTDAELEPDPLPEPSICNRCMRCVSCPGGAIPKVGERDTIKIKIEDKIYEWADVHMGRCTLTHHGLNWINSPFLKQDMPGFKLDVQNSNMSEELAYKLTHTLAKGKWVPSEEFPTDSMMSYYDQIMNHIQYLSVCGGKGCIRACMDSLEKRKCIEQSNFKTLVFPRPDWRLNMPEEDETGGIAEGKSPELFNEPDTNPGNW